MDDRYFWPSVIHALKTTKTLVDVFRMVDSEEEQAMGYMYGDMDSTISNSKNKLEGEEYHDGNGDGDKTNIEIELIILNMNFQIILESHRFELYFAIYYYLWLLAFYFMNLLCYYFSLL